MNAPGGPRRITLLTDFGTADGYVAAMMGVMAAIAPAAALDHAAHDVPPGDILHAALTLSRYATLYPEGTVHLVVVDPGVGSARRALAARVGGRFYVAPDNGVLTRVLQDARTSATPDPTLVELDAPADSSTTFHGRDVFAPAAARLAAGEPLEALGAEATDPVMLPLPEPQRVDGAVVGEVIQVDRFGNLISNIPGDWLTGSKAGSKGEHVHAVVGVGRGTGSDRAGASPAPAGSAADRPDGAAAVEIDGIHRSYSEVASGELVAVIGSLGLLEVSVRDGSAAERLGASRGDPVRVRRG